VRAVRCVDTPFPNLRLLSLLFGCELVGLVGFFLGGSLRIGSIASRISDGDLEEHFADETFYLVCTQEREQEN
jgi:hypothetical protein